jgi:L-fuconolactonase
LPNCPIIDTHLHLWDPKVIRYPWLEGNPLLNKACLLADYNAASGALPVEAMVFVQCEAHFADFEAEARWVADIARQEPKLKGIVAWAPLEKGPAVSMELERLKRHSTLRGIRRIIQFEDDLDFCLRPDFIAGVRTLADFDLSFDICIDHRHMAAILKFVEATSNVRMILDHIGKPAIRLGQLKPWADQIRELARHPHVCCKISGVATEADPKSWTVDQLKRYIEVAVDAFGFDRIMFGSDWPVAIQAIQYSQWITILDEMLTGVDTVCQHKFWRENAKAFYRI